MPLSAPHVKAALFASPPRRFWDVLFKLKNNMAATVDRLDVRLR
jgi:hypothetical protein